MGYNFGQGQRQHHHGWCRPDVKRPHFIPFLACLGRQKNRHQSVSRACEIGSCQCISSLFRPSSLQRTTAIHSSRPGQERGTPGLRSTIHPILLLRKVIIKMCYWMTPWCIYHLGLLSPPMPTRAWTPSNCNLYLRYILWPLDLSQIYKRVNVSQRGYVLNRRNFFPIRVTTSVAVKRLKLLVRFGDDDSTTIFTVVANLRNILCIHCWTSIGK